MTDGIAAAHAADDQYEYLCKLYGEKPRYTHDINGNKILDSYGKHARKLYERSQDDIRREKA